MKKRKKRRFDEGKEVVGHRTGEERIQQTSYDEMERIVKMVGLRIVWIGRLDCSDWPKFHHLPPLCHSDILPLLPPLQLLHPFFSIVIKTHNLKKLIGLTLNSNYNL